MSQIQPIAVHPTMIVTQNILHEKRMERHGEECQPSLILMTKPTYTRIQDASLQKLFVLTKCKTNFLASKTLKCYANCNFNYFLMCVNIICTKNYPAFRFFFKPAVLLPISEVQLTTLLPPPPPPSGAQQQIISFHTQQQEIFQTWKCHRKWMHR